MTEIIDNIPVLYWNYLNWSNKVQNNGSLYSPLNNVLTKKILNKVFIIVIIWATTVEIEYIILNDNYMLVV